MWRRVVWQFNDISEERIAFILRVHNKYEISRITAQSYVCFLWSTDLLFNHEDWRTKSFRNVRKLVSDYMTTFPRWVTAVRTSNSVRLFSNSTNGFLLMNQRLISLQISGVRGNTIFQLMLYKAGCESVKGEVQWDGGTRSTQVANEKHAHHFSRVIWRKESAWHTQMHTGRWHILTACWGSMLQAGRSQVRDPMMWMHFFFSIYLILPAALGPGVYSASNRNEYQKQKNNISAE
jgi:hypothetical protein